MPWQVQTPPMHELPPVHALPHMPQLRLLVWVSTHVPAAPQAVRPTAHLHMPVMQVCWAGNGGAGSAVRAIVCRSTHVPLQLVSRGVSRAFAAATRLAGKTCHPAHPTVRGARLHVDAGRATERETRGAAGHLPDTQLEPFVHAAPHAPQFWLSVCRFTQLVPHNVWPAAHCVWQTPALQTAPAAQGLPQAPQLVELVWRLTH